MSDLAYASQAQPGIPFGGLGFNLSPVWTVAKRLHLAVAGAVRIAFAKPLYAPPVSTLRYGYGLMLSLCRETGGS